MMAINQANSLINLEKQDPPIILEHVISVRASRPPMRNQMHMYRHKHLHRYFNTFLIHIYGMYGQRQE